MRSRRGTALGAVAAAIAVIVTGCNSSRGGSRQGAGGTTIAPASVAPVGTPSSYVPPRSELLVEVEPGGATTLRPGMASVILCVRLTASHGTFFVYGVQTVLTGSLVGTNMVRTLHLADASGADMLTQTTRIDEGTSVTWYLSVELDPRCPAGTIGAGVKLFDVEDLAQEPARVVVQGGGAFLYGPLVTVP